MMSDLRGATIAETMKNHEKVARTTLPAQTYTIVRADGKAFHTFTKGLKRPFDADFAASMDAAAIAMCEQMSGAVMAYVQSDEISVLMTDFATPETQPWYGGQVQKITSVSAAIATAYFNAALSARLPDFSVAPALFDARVFTLPDAETVQTYFGWRQRDCTKNSVSMAASAHFSPKTLAGKNSDERRKMLGEAGSRWDDFSADFKFGRTVTREVYSSIIDHPKAKNFGEVVNRSRWVAKGSDPYFADGRWVGPDLPLKPSA